MKPIIKWGGGKSREINEILPYIPSYKTYIEPFIGGGALFFHIQHNNNVINDIHPELINFYKQIKNGYSNDIYYLMNSYKNNEKDYYYIRDEYKPTTDIEKAFRFFYLRKTCFRGMLRYNKKGKFNVPFGRYKTYNYEILKDNRYQELLKNTEIYNKSFTYIFDKYKSSDNFIFLDPPYDSTFTDYGYCVFGRQEHQELYECFKNTRNLCMMVISSTPFIDKLYKDYIVSKYKKRYAFKIHSNRVGSEIDKYHLIICNYEIQNNVFF